MKTHLKEKSLNPLIISITSVASGCIAMVAMTAMICATVFKVNNNKQK